jgi:hypothetical protein|tara:strand:- start:230 stop:748 length:519 start_codon:yes stop_codon:yes gene_type:complete
MSKKVQIFNNFLDQEVFLEIKKFIMSPRCQWRYVNYIAHKDGRDNDNDGYFVHSFKDCHPQTFEDRYPESPYFPLIVKILDKIQYQNILRIRSSLYPRRDVQKPDPFHMDYNFPHRVCILYVNTNNGYTMLESGEKIPSVENQLATFDGSEKHCSVVQTDTSARYIVNINIL